jgi:hypothetical protein
MCLSVDFDRQPSRLAIEIDHEWTGGMLAAELQSRRTLPQRSPQQHFRQAHVAAKAARSLRSLC